MYKKIIQSIKNYPKTKMTKRVIKDNIYEQSFFLMTGGTAKGFTDHLNKLYSFENDEIDKDVNFKGRHICINDSEDRRTSYIWVRDKDDDMVLIHELFHLVHTSLENIGIKFSDDSEEAFAFYFTYLLRKIREK